MSTCFRIGLSSVNNSKMTNLSIGGSNSNWPLVITNVSDPIDGNNIISLKLNMILGEPGSLEIELSKNHKLLNYFGKELLIISVYEEYDNSNNSREIWRGIESKRTIDFYGNVYILFDGILSTLKYCIGKYDNNFKVLKDPNPSFQDDLYFESSCKEIIENFLSRIQSRDGSPMLPKGIIFEASSDDQIYENYYFRRIESLYDTLDNALKDYLINEVGGYLIPNFPKAIISGNNNSGWEIKYLSSSNLPKSNDETYFYKVARKGKNIVDFQKEISFDDTYSGIFPIGKDGLLITDTTLINDNYVTFPGLIEQFGKRFLIKEYPDISIQNELYGSSRSELSALYRYININLKIDMFDEDILLPEKSILLPGEVFSYISPSGYHLNVLCNECEIDFKNIEKSFWRSGYESNNISNLQNLTMHNIARYKMGGTNDFVLEIPDTDYFENLID